MSADALLENLNLEVRVAEDLRDQPLCPEDIQTAIGILSEMTHSVDEREDEIQVLGLLGTYQRIMGLLKDAEKTITNAITLAEKPPRLKAYKVANSIRLGHICHWNKEYAEAHRLFEACIREIKSDAKLKVYLDFAHQHQGKCYFDEQKYELATASFEQALLLREEKGDSALIQSTKHALEVVKASSLGRT